jgi:hypothetical protein
MQPKTRLGWCACPTIGVTGFGAGNVRLKAAARTQTGTDGGDLLDDADSREQVSLKGALHLLPKLGTTGTLVSDGRKSCAKRPMWISSCTRRWMYFSSK